MRIEALAKLALPKPVVLVNGAFDLIHSGHLKILAAARERAGDGTVVLALDSDRKVSAAKGPGRPILSAVERSVALGYFPIDYLVEIDSDEDMWKLMTLVKPNLRVQGEEYKDHKTRFPKVPRCFVADRGIHTSEIIRRIVEDNIQQRD